MKWRQVDLLTPIITVGTSKTAGGEGRIVPLSNDALQCLMDWRTQFPDALPSHFVFPSERYGLLGGGNLRWRGPTVRGHADYCNQVLADGVVDSEEGGRRRVPVA